MDILSQGSENLKEEKGWQGMAVDRASLSEYGEPINRVGNEVDDAGTDGEGAEPWSRPNYFFYWDSTPTYAYLLIQEFYTTRRRRINVETFI
jgi:hypothetical protein